ncbi:MAG: GntR family transcriptional regulator [Rhodobacteraceae bacterium]|nr:GntR family transcriptional regulator [Paracoccaceae bacterium]
MADKVLAEQIAARLRREILRGKFPPGASIKERDNAIEMGVSRTPMREAIRILAKEGLIVLRHSRSPIVAQPTPKEISDAVDVLLALEYLSADLACRNATDNELAKIRSIHERIAENYNILDPLDLFELDMMLHDSIAQSTHNDAFLATYRSYLERLWRARFLSARQKRNRELVIAEHSAIVEAVEARDTEATKKAIDGHLGRLASNILPVIEEELRVDDT